MIGYAQIINVNIIINYKFNSIFYFPLFILIFYMQVGREIISVFVMGFGS